jgi:isopenicillin-N N-acyltransferase-like protein
VDIETTPGEHRWLYADHGLLVHGNHYQAGTPHQLAGHHRPIAADSLVRVPQARDGLSQVAAAGSPGQTRKLVRQAMSDHLGHPESLCAHPDPLLAPFRRWMTLLSSCVDLTTGEYHVTPGLPCENEYQQAPWNLYDGPGSA